MTRSLLVILLFLPGCFVGIGKESTPSPGIPPVFDSDDGPDARGPWAQVAAGGLHSCAVNTSGAVACWGDDTYDQSSAPAGVFASVATGWSHTCVLDLDGGARCFGRSDFGEAIPDPGGWVQLSGGVSFTCGIDDDDGGVGCWGFDASGRIVPVDTTGLAEVSSGWDHVCVRTEAGAGVCFGVDDNGETQVPARTWVSIAAGNNVSCGVDDAGAVACWGDPSDPIVSDAPTTGDFASVSLGEAFGCALGTDGQAACWGDDGDGATTPPTDPLVQLSAGHRHVCAITEDGDLTCWGHGRGAAGGVDDYGQANPPE